MVDQYDKDGYLILKELPADSEYFVVRQIPFRARQFKEKVTFEQGKGRWFKTKGEAVATQDKPGTPGDYVYEKNGQMFMFAEDARRFEALYERYERKEVKVEKAVKTSKE